MAILSPILRFSIFFVLLLLFPYAKSELLFNFTTFSSNMINIKFEGDSFSSNSALQLTKNQAIGNLTRSTGRASYTEPVRLWDGRNGRQLADFTTHFSFMIEALDPNNYGDGISFFIAPFDAELPNNSSSGLLGLVTNDTKLDKSKNTFVAVEFDSHRDPWDPSDDHVGININSILSEVNVTWQSSIKDGRIANAWVNYNSATKNLSIFLTYADNPIFSGNSSLWFIVDLRDFLPEIVRIGFSASTGSVAETHKIRSWDFNITRFDNGKRNQGLIVGLTLGFGFLIVGLALFGFLLWRIRLKSRKEAEGLDVVMDDEFEKGTGPKRYTYRELSRATGNFTEAGKLGEGGFGGVYKGLLSNVNTEVAVKRVSRGSKQGKKEYVSEVKIISRLRHRNLVQLLGWCHEKGELLLVYEFMPNGSLDSHLFSAKMGLTWNTRYKIAQGLSSSLLYLHEEWEQCVVHRDIKSSNVMLDSHFNAKLGDFGLARLVDHDMGSQTTVLAGTLGYMAPECITTGKASKESDVYAFGVVELEIACGRKPVEPRADPSEVRLVEWVWNMYGKGQLLESADEKLGKDFDEQQMECLMVVGLWCCHPDFNLRPNIRQVINVLNFEGPLPNLPSKLPVPMYYAPPMMNALQFSYTSTGLTNSEKSKTEFTNSSTTSTYSSTSAGSGKALLNTTV